MSDELNHSQAQVINQLLINLGLCSDPLDEEDWPCYFSHMPDTPDTAICVYNTECRQFGHDQFTGVTQEHNGIMIVVRGTSQTAARRRAKIIANRLDRVDRVSVLVETDVYIVDSVIRFSDVIDNGPERATSLRRKFSYNAFTSIHMLTAEETGTGTI
jgi:hypothetical protein